MAQRTCDNRCHRRLPILLAVAALALPASATVAAPASTADEYSPATSDACGTRDSGICSTRFSELAELTPANVRGLTPLVAGRAAVVRREERLTGLPPTPQRGLQVDTAASVDLRLQRFVEERVQSELAMQDRVHFQLLAGTLSSAVSYLLDSRRLRAWDPVQQRVLWSVRDALPGASRTLITAGGLVFYATRDGWLKALDARTGRELWKHRVPGVPGGRLEEVSSYRGPDGHQYIAVRTMPGDQLGATRPAPSVPQSAREAPLVFALVH